MNGTTNAENAGGSGSDNNEELVISKEKTENKLERVHPHHWCGQHKFEADSPTNVYDYTTTKIREKSAMCKVAEIARFNKIKHYYDLQDESGPAHKKLFTVKLVLTPNETYEGSGPSIKRAQQASAEEAVKHTQLPIPSDKNARRKGSEIAKPYRVLQNVCRALRYSAPTYITCNPPMYPDVPPQHIILPPGVLPPFQHPFPYMHGPHLIAVIVNIDGKSIATGLGDTFLSAKQDAAIKALAVLTPLMREQQQNIANNENISTEDVVPVHKQKSVISDIHERAHQLKLSVIFEILKEEGPPHDRQYVVRCAFVTSTKEVQAEAIGKGKKKKFAQQEACTQLLKTVEHLRPLPNPVTLATTVCKTQKKLASINKEPKRKTIVKDKKMDPLYGHQINPVSRLIQVTQAKSREHPTFELVGEHGVSKYKEFVIRVQYGDETREGKGPNKRLAKRAAAEAMLETIGFVKPLPPPGKSLLKKNLDCNDSTMAVISHWTGPPSPVEPVKETPKSEPVKKVDVAQQSPRKDVDDTNRGTSPDNEKRRVTFNSEVHACPPPGDQDYPTSIIQSLKKDAIVEGKFRKLKRSKENRRSLTMEQLLELSEKAEHFLNSKVATPLTENADPTILTARHQLDQLSETFKFSVGYTAFPPVGPNNFTIVSIGLDTPLVGHGAGLSTADADEKAAYDAIIKLRQLYSSAVSPTNQTTAPMTSPTPIPS
ncbi:unnamed protein product [Caenorhabditis brenneri]